MSFENHIRHCEYESLAAAAALYALDPEDEAGLEMHLSTCPRCRQVLKTGEETAAILGSAVIQEQPPVQLRTRILDLAAATPQLSRRISRHTGGPAAPERPVRSDVVPIRPRHRLSRAFAAAAAVVLIAAVVGLGIRVGQLTSERDAQQAQAVTTANVLHELEDPTARLALLRNADQQAVAMVIAGRRTLVLPVRLPPNGPNQTYVLWGTSTARPQALATFSVAAGDAMPERFQALTGTEGDVGFAVSIEPGHTAPDAPTRVIASGGTPA